MNRWFAAAAAALALAACTENALLDGREPAGRRASIVWSPAETIFPPLTPSTALDATGGWEVGTLFTTDDTILVTGFQYYKASGETGSHISRLWTSGGTLLASRAYASETAGPGWQSTTLSSTVQLAPGTYIVSVNTNTWQSKTPGYFFDHGPIYRTHLTATGGAYVSGVGNFPSNGSASAFFADLTFRPKLCNTTTDFPCP